MQIKKLKTTKELVIRTNEIELRRWIYHYFCGQFRGEYHVDLFHALVVSWQYLADWQQNNIVQAVEQEINERYSYLKPANKANLENFLKQIRHE